MPQCDVSDVEQVDATNGVFKYDRETDTLYVDYEKLQKFASELNERDCVILECLISTSQDPSDLFNLTIGWLRRQEGETNLFRMGNRNKTREPFKTFFSEEATASVREYVMRHRRDAGVDEPIFIKHCDYDYKYNGGTIDVGGHMNAGTLNSNFRLAAEKLGHTESGKQNPFRPKRFRHLLRTAAATARLDEGITQCFMGHSTSISGTYLSKDPSWLLDKYLRMQGYVTIFTSPSEREDVKKLKKSLEAARLELDEFRRS